MLLEIMKKHLEQNIFNILVLLFFELFLNNCNSFEKIALMKYFLISILLMLLNFWLNLRILLFSLKHQTNINDILIHFINLMMLMDKFFLLNNLIAKLFLTLKKQDSRIMSNNNLLN